MWAEWGAGAAGAGVWILIIHGLPLARKAIQGEVQWAATLQRVVGLIGFVLGYLILGAAAAWFSGADAAREAFAWGLGWQGVFGQYVKRGLAPETTSA
jgi:hypothetical protein